ncbi:M24 family metallopeptidase [Bacillus taeanensis]|uniref:Aminopeptidase P family protein n=1 Tax=Bacillus taeanensis TaxID=273032 RepID=A0A366Y215_9BACI|nr:Xaa-Pro peptidase family protein [Bacillus taeanensis]RBW71029.1 aminopeptidase P family protein [Bacillus taeanensis]
MNQRLQHLAQWLKEQNHCFALLTSTANVFYLTNFYTNPHERLVGLLVFSEEEPFLVCPGMEVSQARDAGWKGEIIGYSDSDNPWELIHISLKKRNIKEAESIAVEKEQLSYKRAEEVIKRYPNASLHSLETKMNELRLIKDKKEITVLSAAAKLADFGVKRGVQALKEGVTEMEVVAAVEYALKKKGVREMSFSTMVLFGEKSGQPHGHPGDRKLTEGDFVLFDLGVRLDGYCSDITRTVVYKKINEKQKEIYELVLKAQLETLEICKPGIRIGDLDTTARTIITNGGYDKCFPHRIGHGLGIDVHEYPSMNSKNDGVLQEGMVFTIEPGIYLPDLGGVRIEDDLFITKDGCQVFTHYPKNLQIVT